MMGAVNVAPAASVTTLKRERVHDLWPELLPLLEKHYREIAHFQDIPLDVNQSAYERMEDAGTLRVFTARSTDDVLIGYAVFFVHRNVHYSSSLQAVQDVIYVDPEQRGTYVGYELATFCDDELRKDGVEVVLHHVKRAHQALGRLLDLLEYEAVETVYVKRLKERR
jgi:L-amino acid N-acyltransferase YncA